MTGHFEPFSTRLGTYSTTVHTLGPNQLTDYLERPCHKVSVLSNPGWLPPLHQVKILTMNAIFSKYKLFHPS